jgi:uncharacterized membrane protein HdeD (DUF308 family)
VTAAIGILLLALREQAMPFIVMCLGVLFMLPGIFTLALFLIPKLRRNSTSGSSAVIIPIMAFGSLLLGLWMFLQPAFFVTIIMLILGAVMIIMGGTQIVSLLMAKKRVKVSLLLFFLPLLILLTGAIVLLNPFEAASVPFIILGVGAIVTALSDMINTLFLKFTDKGNRVGVADENIEIVDED